MQLIDELLVYVFRLKKRRDEDLDMQIGGKTMVLTKYGILNEVIDELEEIIEDEQKQQMKKIR